MARDYRQLSESVRAQLNPENYYFEKSFSDELSTISYSNVLTFVRLAMKGVEPEYTRKSKEAGEKVKAHLSPIRDVVFKYQGSIMTDTHVKGYSDIDLLTISDKFFFYDRDGISNILGSYERLGYSASSLFRLQRVNDVTPYTGNSIHDLWDIREQCEHILSATYEVCDIGKPKAIRIRNKSLNRDVDIVVANWYDDVTSVINDRGDYRGIQIFNKETISRENPDYPFLSIKRINDRSSETNGRLKKMIRFLKNLRNFSQSDIKLSSFDINSICYDINVSDYHNVSFHELVPVLYKQLKSICTNTYHSDRIVSVDGREYIFRDNQEKLKNVKLLLNEVQGVFVSLDNNVYA
ncbi:MAG: hypothetical protein JST49_00615 [Bacteroidetes bacterium]|nr:hypothetical protein [Bacteroidota bacterium]